MQYPLLPITPTRAIGWLDTGDRLRCVLPFPDYTPGRDYAVKVHVIAHCESGHRVGWPGPAEPARVITSETVVTVYDDLSRNHLYRSAPTPGDPLEHSFEDLVRHFDIPTVPSVTDIDPAGYADSLIRFDAIAPSLPFPPRAFQREDLARASLVDSLVLAWDPGLGKTIAAFVWPMLKRATRALIVVPPSLVGQYEAFARRCGLAIHPILTPEDFRARRLPAPPPPRRSPRYYVTTYTALKTRSMDALFETAMKNGAGVNCVVLDEGVRLQGAGSRIAASLRRLQARYRLILSATPIKNRMDSVAPLLSWISAARPRSPDAFPYPDNPKGRSLFALAHLCLQIPFNGTPRRVPVGCNLMPLWRHLDSLILRRRKRDVAGIPPCTLHHITLLPSRPEWTTYGATLARTGQNVTPALNRLRQICLHGHSIEPALPDASQKLLATLHLIAWCLRSGHQVLVGSPFLGFSAALVRWLGLAGISAARADGTVSPSRRAALALAFRSGNIPVMVAGLQAMGEGHNFPQCSCLILPSLSWARDENEQFLHRCWRIDSAGPVNAFSLSLAGTIDDYLAQHFCDKQGSSLSALDSLPMPNPAAGIPAQAVTASPARVAAATAALPAALRAAIAAYHQNRRAPIPIDTTAFPPAIMPLVGSVLAPMPLAA